MSTETTQIAPVIDAHLDPVKDVVDALIKAGHPDPFFWLPTLRMVAPNASDKSTSGTWRRMMVNRALHILIGEIPMPSAPGIRFLLVDQGSHEDWVCLMNENIAPWLALVAKNKS